MTSSRSRLLFLFIAIAFRAAAQSTTTISFDDFPPGTELRNQYAAKGVHFRGSTIYTNNAPHSGTRVLYAVPPNVEAFTYPGSLPIDFDTAQRSVRLFAGPAGTEAVTATLTAFDAAGHAIAHDGPRSLPAGPIKNLMEVKVPQPAIRRVELLFANDSDEVLDDLTFEGLPVGNLPTDPPKVTITSPKANQQTSQNTFTVEGTVTGPQLDSHAVLKVHVPRPPGSSATADSTYQLNLVENGPPNTRSFMQVVTLGIGPQTISVDAENTAGKHGTATVVIDALPDPIRARLRQEGGTPVLGAFSFGSLFSTTCSYAVYAQGAVVSASNATFMIRGPIFKKWIARQDQSKFPELGCAQGEERMAAATGRAQDFIGGRIYSSPSGVFFVPPVFTAAIDTLGGEAGVGLPTADPTSDSRPAFNTWLFQRFARKGIPLASTLEIRGNPPKLVIQRQAGDGSLFADILRPNNPTIVQSFDCQTTAGPCPVAAPPDEPLMTNTAAFCNNKEFNWKQLVGGVFGGTPDPPEWVPIKGHFVQTPIWGALFDVHLAKGDNPFAHENRFEPCPTPTLEALVNETICPSDWDLKIRPLPGFRSLQAEGRDAVQIEFERVYFQAHLVGYGDPTPGDMLFTSGRLIVDCGHGPKFKTEIHPPSVYASVSSITRNGKPSTQADIWVNRFFSGGTAPTDAVEFDIFPPPRPNPQALLGASTPGDQSGAVSVTFKAQGPYGPFRVRVTAKPGKPEVTKYGEMKLRNDDGAFGFDGRLQVFWNCPGGAC